MRSYLTGCNMLLALQLAVGASGEPRTAAIRGATRPLEPQASDQRMVAERAQLLAVIRDKLPDDGPIGAVRSRDLIQCAGIVRPTDPSVMSHLIRALAKEPPIRHDWVRRDDMTAIPREGEAPAVFALARIGLPAVPALVQAYDGFFVPRAQAANAAESLRLILNSRVRYWGARQFSPSRSHQLLHAVEAAVPPEGVFHPLTWPPEGTGVWTPLPLLWSPVPRQPRSQPPGETPGDLAGALVSEEDGVRFAAVIAICRRRYEQVRWLARRVRDRRSARDDRLSAQTTLGRIRGVSKEAGEALLARARAEPVRPGVALSEWRTPAALALVRIDIPMVPLLTKTIRTSGDARLRSVCGGIMAAMLGQYARPWLADEEKQARTPEEKRRVAAVLKEWGPYCKGEGYWAEQEGK